MFAAVLTRYRTAYAGLPREVWLLSLVLFVNRSGTMVIPFLTLYLTSQLGMSEAAAGRMISVYGVGAICGAYLSGRFSERVGALRLQTVCMFLAAPLYLLVGVWNTWPGIAASLFALSIVNEAVRPANATSITKLTTAATRTRAFSLQRLAANLGFSIGPVVGGLLARVNFTWLFVIDGLTTLVAAAALLHFFRMKRIDGTVSHSTPIAAPASPLADRTFIAFLALTLVSMMVFMQYNTTYPLYLRDHFGLNEAQTGLLYAVNTSLIVTLEMLLISAIKQWRLMRTIALGTCIFCLGFGMLPFGQGAAYAVLAMAVVTLGEMLSFAQSSTFVANRARPGAEGAYIGWYTVIHALAWVLGPGLGAAIYQYNPDRLWHVAIVVGALALTGFSLLARRVDDQRCGAAEPPPTPLPPPVELPLDQLAHHAS
jgi:predicted MFS family arabinose efflux permease